MNANKKSSTKIALENERVQKEIIRQRQINFALIILLLGACLGLHLFLHNYIKGLGKSAGKSIHEGSKKRFDRHSKLGKEL
mmetsp:Transcript_39168/g.82382  ORF Transcript_39168/g.82382 Transcript_39168/m.82382 type:complete len:81 (-) Transcript_39168:1225-1467(-)